MKNKFLLTILLVVALALVSCKQKDSRIPDSGSGKTDTELSTINESINKNANNPTLYIQRAEYYLKNEQLNNALADINKAIGLKPDNPRPYFTLSSIFVLMGKPQQALDVLNKVISLDAANKDAYLKKAKLYLVMKDYEKCAETVQKVFDLDPRNADAFYLKGVVLDENGETAKAIASFRQTVQSDPNHYDALMHLGYANTDTKPLMAIDYFNSALKVNPTSLETMYNLGMLYQENGHPEKALEIYGSMLKLNPTNKLALYNSGYVNLVYMQKYSVGADFFSKAIASDSTYTEAWYNRGYCYELAGDPAKARIDYEKVLKLKTNDIKAAQGLNRLDKARR